MTPSTLKHRRAAKAQVALQDRGLPGAIVLLQVLVASGENPRRALTQLNTVVGATASQTPLAAACAALGSVTIHLELGASFADAVIAVERDNAVSSSVVRVLDLMRRSEVDGEPLLAHLEILATDFRRRRATALDEAAQRLTLSMLFPLVLCILPAFIVLAVVPLVVNAIAGLPT